jgi:uncharacterized protein YkwD
MHRKCAAGFVALALAVGLSGCAPAPTYTNASVKVPAEQYFERMLNGERAAHGVHGLIPHGVLTDKARQWANWMAIGGCGAGVMICHSHLSDGVNGHVTSWTLLGENVGVGPQQGALWAAFVHSPGHYQNIMNDTWMYVGIGVVKVGPRYFVAMEFMRP